MKVLLDEDLPHLLRNNPGRHEVFTVRYKGWAGLTNGELLTTAEDDGFGVFITGDQTLSYEASRRVSRYDNCNIEYRSPGRFVRAYLS